MRTRILLPALLLIAAVSLNGFVKPAPPSADQVLKQAYAQAKKEHKNVILLFHASWCGWCKKMEASLNEPALKKSFDDNYVITWLTVEESKGKEDLENPGGMEVKTKYHGEKAGLPFFVILDARGNLLADSYIRPDGAPMDKPGDNMGCPASEKEVAHFSDIIKATSKIQEPQLALIRERFRKNEAAPAATAPKPVSGDR